MGDMSLVDLGKRLLDSAKAGLTEEVRNLMTNGAPFTTDWLGTSALHMAAQHDHLETAEVLLRGGISRDARTKVDRTPLHIAAQEGHLDLVKLLITHGAEVEARDMLRMTPLHWAAERQHIHVARVLVKQGADVCAQSKFDKSPLDIAADNQHLVMVELFTKHIGESATVKQYHKATESIVTEENLNVPLLLKSQLLNASAGTAAFRGMPGITVRSANVSQPVLVRTNLAGFQKTGAATSSFPTASSDSEGEGNDPGGTNVLATLAALAEATAPNASISTADALHWLELNGITMLPTDNSSLVASALEGGQTVSLTEAGKLALTWVKEQQNLNSASNAKTKNQGRSGASATQSVNLNKNKKVITIVADQSHIPSIVSSPQTPIVVLSSPSQTTNATTPPFKKLRAVSSKIDVSKLLTNGITSTGTKSDDDERLKLKDELEKIKKQAELYKSQLMQKEHEAEEYKKQLEQMKTPSV